MASRLRPGGFSFLVRGLDNAVRGMKVSPVRIVLLGASAFLIVLI